ncbi:MAG: hypothetical protein ACUVQ5_03245 [Candidatus Methanomethylicaceae archaeon]
MVACLRLTPARAERAMDGGYREEAAAVLPNSSSRFARIGRPISMMALTGLGTIVYWPIIFPETSVKMTMGRTTPNAVISRSLILRT